VSAAAAATTPKAEPRTVLVVEDDADIAHSFADLLTDSGYSVRIAPNGRIALERLISESRPDLILLDLKLPERSGFDVLAAIQKSVTLVGVPVIVVSAFVGRPPAGAVAWMRKPAKPAEVLALVHKYTGARDEKSATAQLRYRFDLREQLKNHLYVVDGRALFFYADPTLQLASGARVLLEIILTDSGQQSILRGQAMGRNEGSAQGVWLEFQDTRLARRAAEGPIAARTQRRLPTDLLVRASGELPAQLCRLLDVSAAGARLGGLSAPVPADSIVELKLMSQVSGVQEGGLCRARVLRTGQGEAAVRFLRDEAPTRQLVAKLMFSVEAAWANARELQHPSVCCGPRGAMDPPLPRLARRA
jgi:DNA-binding response OmpR family regulator